MMRSMYKEVPSVCSPGNWLFSEKREWKSRVWLGALVFFFFGIVPSAQAGFKGDIFNNLSLGIWGDRMDSGDGVDIGPLAFKAEEGESPLKSELLERFASRMTGFPFEKGEDGISEGFEWRSGRIPAERVKERLGDLHEKLHERFQHRWGEGSGPPEAVVPLPPAVLLFGSALGFLVGVGRRRFRLVG